MSMVLRFLACSGLAAMVNLIVGQVLYGLAGLDDGWQYGFSVALAFISGMAISYVLNRRYTFPPSGRAMHDEITAFFMVSIGGLVLTTGIAQALYSGAAPELVRLARVFSLPLDAETLAHVMAVGITAVYSFLAHKGISFRRAKAARDV